MNEKDFGDIPNIPKGLDKVLRQIAQREVEKLKKKGIKLKSF